MGVAKVERRAERMRVDHAHAIPAQASSNRAIQGSTSIRSAQVQLHAHMCAATPLSYIAHLPITSCAMPATVWKMRVWLLLAVFRACGAAVSARLQAWQHAMRARTNNTHQVGNTAMCCQMPLLVHP